MKIVGFKAAPGASFGDNNAKIYAEFLDELVQKGTELTPPEVVKAAQDTSSPIHKEFEWDDVRCGILHRLQQARYLMNHINALIENNNGDIIEARWYHHIKTQSQVVVENIETVIIKNRTVIGDIPETADEWKKKHGYYNNLSSVSENPDEMDYVIEKARRELESWKYRYGQYEALKEMTARIGKVLAECV